MLSSKLLTCSSAVDPDSDSTGFLDPYPDWQSGSRTAKMIHKLFRVLKASPEAWTSVNCKPIFDQDIKKLSAVFIFSAFGRQNPESVSGFT
jgi:hypothetical protein